MNCGKVVKNIGKLVDLTGKRFGRLSVISRGENCYISDGNPIVTWDCVCDCGNKKNVRAGDLRSGKTLSYGCLFLDIIFNVSHRKYNSYDNSIAKAGVMNG